MSAPAVTTVVITDTNVLINFLHIGQLALLGELPAYRLQLPIEVLQELTVPDYLGGEKTTGVPGNRRATHHPKLKRDRQTRSTIASIRLAYNSLND